MKNFTDFFFAALPWLCMGLALAIFFAESARKSRKRKESSAEKKDNYGLEGMSLGMCFGVALGTAFGYNTGIGLSLGMLIGYAIGSCMKKTWDGDER